VTEAKVNRTCEFAFTSHVTYLSSWNGCAASSLADVVEKSENVVDCRMVMA
jgi:hypothetical protein